MPGFGTASHPIRKHHRPYSTALVLTAAFSDKTDRSIVTPKHEIRLHRERNKHIKQPLQAAEHNVKNVNMKVLLSLTKVLKLHITIVILYLYILEAGRSSNSCQLLYSSHGSFWVLF